MFPNNKDNMLTLQISETDIEILRYERYHYPCPLVQKRLHALYLKATSTLSHQQIAQLVGIHRSTLTSYIHLYHQKGLAGVYEVGYGTNRSELDQHTTSLLNYFSDHPPQSSTEAIAVIKRLTGIERSPTQVRHWLHKQGFKPLRAGQTPSKANPEKQEIFIEQTLNPLIEQAKTGELHLFFLDAAHFVTGVFLPILWCIKRVFIKSSAGRKRYNVLGAVNAITKKIHTLTNDSYVNAQTIIDFLEQLRKTHQDGKPIYIVLDNARYQKCQIVQYMAWFLDIHLVYIPPYSPNLNIIERLWKWTKKKCLYAKFYENFQDFKEAIDHTLDKANQRHQKELDRLLSLKFQRF